MAAGERSGREPYAVRAGERAVGARERAVRARERAARELRVADRYERLAKLRDRAVFIDLAVNHRRAAACHMATARIHDSFAGLMTTYEQRGGSPPPFMSGVAHACGTDSAAVTLYGRDHRQLAVAASDPSARAAQGLEYVLGEGPAQEAADTCVTVCAEGADIVRRWPGYGQELAGLGLHSVVAVPLCAPGPVAGGCVGALTVFDPRVDVPGAQPLAEVADALARSVLLGPEGDEGLCGGADVRPEVHQAAGMVSVRQGCTVQDALALIRARAFVDGDSVEAVADRIVGGELELA